MDERRWLIRPPEGADWFDSFNVWVYGITAEMVADVPRWKDALPAIIEFIGGDVVVAHKAGFNIGVIRYAGAVDTIEWPQMRFLCTLVEARRALALPSYHLPFVTKMVAGLLPLSTRFSTRQSDSAPGARGAGRSSPRSGPPQPRMPVGR